MDSKPLPSVSTDSTPLHSCQQISLDCPICHTCAPKQRPPCTFPSFRNPALLVSSSCLRVLSCPLSMASESAACFCGAPKPPICHPRSQAPPIRTVVLAGHRAVQGLPQPQPEAWSVSLLVYQLVSKKIR